MLIASTEMGKCIVIIPVIFVMAVAMTVAMTPLFVQTPPPFGRPLKLASFETRGFLLTRFFCKLIHYVDKFLALLLHQDAELFFRKLVFISLSQGRLCLCQLCLYHCDLCFLFLEKYAIM